MRILSCFYVFLIYFGFGQAQTNTELADQFYATGNYTKAIELYKSLDNADLYIDKIAKAYVAIGNLGEALNTYRRALENQKDDLILYNYAKLLTKTKSFSKAEELFRALISSDSLNPNYHYELGLALEKQNDSLALDEFMSTYRLDQTHQKAIFKIAKHHLIKRNFKSTHHFVDQGLDTYKSNTALISLKAQAYYHQDYYNKAIEWFKRLLELGEKSEFIHEKLSLCYAQKSNYKDAIYHRKEALRYNPYDASSIYVIGTYYERLSNFEMAESFISKSIKLMDTPLSKEYQLLGTVLNRQNKHKEAIKAFQNSLKEDPSNKSSEFFIIMTKETYYKDIDAKIKVYEDYLEKNKAQDHPFKKFAEDKLRRLKEEKFLKQN